MNQPITPPLELLKQWEDDWFEEREHADVLLIQAFQVGADQELEACCEWLKDEGCPGTVIDLRAARRPRPPNLKEQALSSLTRLVVDLDRANMRDQATILEGPIRRALEQLDD
jgi:hypothetical protein